MDFDAQNPLLTASILVVDDQRTNLTLLERILGQEGYANVTTVTDPRKVVSQLSATEPDLVLLDMHMPHLDGEAVLAQIKDFCAPDAFIPVVILTADMNEFTKLTALAAGAHDFLTKPFDVTEVLLRIGNLLRTRRLHLELEAQNRHLDQIVAARTRALRESLDELQRVDNERRQLLKRLVGAQDTERRRIAADIHDDTLQAMIAAKMQLNLAQRRKTISGPASELDAIDTAMGTAIERMRSLVFDLHPAALDEGLSLALEDLLERICRDSGNSYDFDDGETMEEPDITTRVALFRNAWEGLNNVRKHAPGTHVSVKLAHVDGGWLLKVRDRGPGMPRDQREASSAGHFGLKSMYERSAALGGRCTVGNAAHGGVEVECWLPDAR